MEIPVPSTMAGINTSQYMAVPCDLLLYDILARNKEDNIVKALQQVGVINKISIKRQYKYQNIKININLEKDLDKLIQTKMRSFKLTIGLDK